MQYGGGILIKEVKSGKIDRSSAFLALSMLNLVHAVIEDTLLMMADCWHLGTALLPSNIFWINTHRIVREDLLKEIQIFMKNIFFVLILLLSKNMGIF